MHTAMVGGRCVLLSYMLILPQKIDLVTRTFGCFIPNPLSMANLPLQNKCQHENQGRNLAGREGIFPKDYTTPAGPLMPDIRTPTGQSHFNVTGYESILQPLTEENESDSALWSSAHNAGTQKGLSHPTGGILGANGPNGGHMMAATMTDIQQAIDQLGVHRSNSGMTDDGRSISFVSTRDGRNSIDDHDKRYDDRNSIRDSIYEEGGGGRERTTMNEDWHRNARRRLFERVDQMDEAARRAQEEQEQEERAYHRPPVDVEFSDESEDEDGHHHHGRPQDVPNDLLHRLQPHHDDSIPSTIPSTFPGDPSTRNQSLSNREDDGGDADVSNATAGQTRGLTDSPAKADSPTLAPSRSATLDLSADQPPAASNQSEHHQDVHATPVQEPTRNLLAATPEPKAESASAAPSEVQAPLSKSVGDNAGDAYLPVMAPTSPFTTSPFGFASNASSVPGSSNSYSVASSTNYSPSQGQSKPGTQSADPALKPSTPASSSYISFLPSPTAPSFPTAPNAAAMSLQATVTAPDHPGSLPPRAEPITERGMEGNALSMVPSTGGDNSYTPHAKPNGGGDRDVVASMSSSSLTPPANNFTPALASPSSITGGKKGTPPVEWTVEQVVEWIRSKGFDEGVCGKFAEHEITGDVLLELDVNMLKEIDIVAFGKRMKIAHAINELRRPPSFESSDAASLPPQSLSQFPLSNGSPSVPQSATAVNFSPSASMPHLLGSAGGHSHSMSHSTQGGYAASISSAAPSMRSPNIFGVMQSQAQIANGGYSPGPYAMPHPEGSLPTGDVAGHASPSVADQQKVSTKGGFLFWRNCSDNWSFW